MHMKTVGRHLIYLMSASPWIVPGVSNQRGKLALGKGLS